MAEIDWDEVLDTLRSLTSMVEQTTREFCEEGYFRGCLIVNEKIVPILRQMTRDIEASRQVEELAEESPELAGEEEEESETEEE